MSKSDDQAVSPPPKDEDGPPPPEPFPSFAQFVRGLMSSPYSLFYILILAACASPISKLALAPTYGGAASGIDHDRWIHIELACGFYGYAQMHGTEVLNLPYLWSLLPVLVAWAPAIQYQLLPFHHLLGPISFWPVWAGVLDRDIIVLACGSALAHSLAEAGLQCAKHVTLPFTLLLMGALLLTFWPFERILSVLVSKAITSFDFLTPIHLQLGLAMGAACVFRSWRSWLLSTLMVPPILHALFVNPHSSSTAVDVALRQHNWTLVERRWSTTGYISVLDSFEAEYRVLRCDHSLLGGEWVLTDQRRQKQGWNVNEPIYAVFQMLEAVRLVELDPPIQDSSASALVIGLGIGTAPKALLAHRITTTVVELDPVVHEFATKYFSLPTNHTAILSDAVAWAETEAASANPNKYDYILHDVFTGGSEPLVLFTSSFLGHLRALLKPNGVIALNYAGDPDAPLTKTVLHTILTAFDSQCRIFRDHAPSEDTNFSNIVLFCRNSPGAITFRQPTQQDYLRSHSRKYYMMPKEELEIELRSLEDAAVLTESDAMSSKHKQAQADSAVRHWYIMRTVLPDAVWDLW